MSKCRNCNVEISDETERCPLCGSVLEYTGEVENMYPDVRVHTRKMTMISKIYLFCALLVEVLLIYINVVTESQIAWSAITGLGFFYGYMLIRFAMRGFGIAGVAEDFALEAMEKGEIFRLHFDREIPKRHFCIVTDEKVPMTAAARRFLDLLEDKCTPDKHKS